MTAIDHVICIHGIWGQGIEMTLIKRRLEKEYGFRVRLFSYPSVRGTLDANAEKLATFVAAQGLDGVHLLGHSLGGILALRMLANHPDTVPGRVVCVGSPLTGSRVVSLLSLQNWAEPFLGHSLPAGLVPAAANEWATHVCATREVGVIAGTVPVGVGRLVTKFDGDNDGSVAVSETRLDGAKDHICLKVSHKGMLVSSDVVDQAAAFLRRGEFLRDAI